MIDYDKLEKVGEYKDGKLSLWFKKASEEEGDVYLLKFGTDTYIGSTTCMKRRMNTHISMLRSGKHQTTKMQEIFNSNMSFDIYLLMRISGIGSVVQFAEQALIKLLNPTISSCLPKGNTCPFTSNLWTISKEISQ
ncbi:hypothetical protein NXW23_11730 [Bacteroides caccae]|jgi:hypothetical protein|uniref:GIY-YIG domain-containing protein n=1 Tax=Bacteroides caccae TaxID=47678 RepID=A0AA94XYN7_9BACE|nr:hypothetical protein NXW23_11730 [Bacteroides caccae]DAO28238.1 MAG TPA: GIY-YIG nuclease superfamily protein [Caudoviricetes sp.]